MSILLNIGWNTFREAVRQKFFHFLVLLSAALVGSSFFFRQFDFGSGELRFIADFGFGGLFLFGAILSVVMTAQLYHSELENRTALTLLARPVRRWQFLGGKLLGVAALLAVFTAAVLLLLAVILFTRETFLMQASPGDFPDGRQVSYTGLLLYGLIEYTRFLIIAGIALFIGSFAASNLFTVVVSFIVVLICQLQYIAQDGWERAENVLTRGLLWLLSTVLPNFQLFNVGQPLAFPERGHELPAAAPFIVVYGLLYALVFFALAVFAFRKREV